MALDHACLYGMLVGPLKTSQNTSITTSSLWLFQLDDSKSLHGKWLFHQTTILN